MEFWENSELIWENSMRILWGWEAGLRESGSGACGGGVPVGAGSGGNAAIIVKEC